MMEMFHGSMVESCYLLLSVLLLHGRGKRKMIDVIDGGLCLGDDMLRRLVEACEEAK